MKVNVQRTWLMKRVQVYEVEVPDDFDFDRDVVENLDTDFEARVSASPQIDDYVGELDMDEEREEYTLVERSADNTTWVPATNAGA